MTYRVAVLGSGEYAGVLRRYGVTDVSVLPAGTAREYDDTDQVWRLRTPGGAEYRARIVVEEHPAERSPAPYLGVAVHGMPNHFLVDGPEEARFVAACLRAMERRGSTRIEVRYSTQCTFNLRPRSSRPLPWGRLARKIPSAFHLSSHDAFDDDVFDGEVTVGAGPGAPRMRARLTGHLEPVDGRYHWRGTLFGDVTGLVITVSVGDRSAQARVTERSPRGTCSVSGTGAPPFPLDDVEVAVPQR